MPFPNAENAIIPKAKIVEYLLNANHPVGGPKAIWLQSLGYSLDHWQELSDDLARLARTSDNYVAKSSPFGVKYVVLGEIGCPGHPSATVISVWIVEEKNPPRFVTAYPE